MTVYIKATFLPGTGIRSAINDAIEVADRLNVGVEFELNGLKLHVKPGDSFTEKLEQWDMIVMKELNREPRT